MPNKIIYYPLLILFNVLPTWLLHFCIRPLWFSESDLTNITSAESLITILLLPLYLVIVNYKLMKRYTAAPFSIIINTLLMLGCIWLSVYLHFINWSDSIGNNANPDNDTIEVFGFLRLIGYIAIVTGSLIIFFRLKTRYKQKDYILSN